MAESVVPALVGLGNFVLWTMNAWLNWERFAVADDSSAAQKEHLWVWYGVFGASSQVSWALALVVGAFDAAAWVASRPQGSRTRTARDLRKSAVIGDDGFARTRGVLRAVEPWVLAARILLIGWTIAWCIAYIAQGSAEIYIPPAYINTQSETVAVIVLSAASLVATPVAWSRSPYADGYMVD